MAEWRIFIYTYIKKVIKITTKRIIVVIIIIIKSYYWSQGYDDLNCYTWYWQK